MIKPMSKAMSPWMPNIQGVLIVAKNDTSFAHRATSFSATMDRSMSHTPIVEQAEMLFQ